MTTWLNRGYPKRSSDLQIGELIAANLLQWFAPSAPALLLVGKQLIDQAATCRRHRGPGGWTDCRGDYSRLAGDHTIWVSECDHGWFIERIHCGPKSEEQVLSLWKFPLLCPDHKVAQLLADVGYPNPPSKVGLLQWIDRHR